MHEQFGCRSGFQQGCFILCAQGSWLRNPVRQVETSPFRLQSSERAVTGYLSGGMTLIRVDKGHRMPSCRDTTCHSSQCAFAIFAHFFWFQVPLETHGLWLMVL